MEALMKQKRWVDAIDLSDTLLDSNDCESVVDIRYRRGECHKELGNLLKCVEEWQTALRYEREAASNCEKVKCALAGLRDQLLMDQDKCLDVQLPDVLLGRVSSGDADGVRELRKWKRQILLRDNIIHILTHKIRSGDVSTDFTAAVWDVFRWFVLPEEEVTADTITRDFLEPLKKPPQLNVYQKALGKLWTVDQLCDAGTAALKANAATEAVSILSILKRFAKLEHDTFLRFCSKCLDCVDTLDVVRAAVLCLGIVADEQRKLGVNVKALKNSHNLSMCMSSLMVLAEEEDMSAKVVLAELLRLLADKERAPGDMVDMAVVVDALLDGFLADPRTAFTEEWKAGLAGLDCLFTADRDAARLYIQRRSLLPLLIGGVGEARPEIPGLQRLSAECLVHALEFVELRQTTIEEGGIETLCKWLSRGSSGAAVRCRICVCLSRLCVHDESVRALVFDFVNFFDILQDVLSEVHNERLTDKSEDLTLCVLEIVFFLSMHGKFKSKLLKPSHKKIMTELSRVGSSMCSDKQSTMCKYLYCGAIYNLVRSREDKEKMQKKPGGVDLDDTQLADLEMLYEKLPPEAKPMQNGSIDLGSPDTANEIRKAMCDGQVVQHLSKIICGGGGVSQKQEEQQQQKQTQKQQPVTPQIISSGCMAIRLVCSVPALRGSVIAQGGVQALLKGCDNLKDENQRRTRQALSQLCITTNPSLFTYRQALDIVPHLLALLTDDHELYQYEAALALTNITSLGDDARCRVWHGQGWRRFGDLLFSENDMLRSAGLEGWCNMCPLELVMDSVAQKKHNTDIKLLCAFAAEYSNPRAQKAATGALATLAAHPDVGCVIGNSPNFDNLLTLLKDTTDRDLQIRCEALFAGMMESASVPDCLKVKITEAVKVKKTLPPAAASNGH
eukprot:GHVQ01000987.1.p1 GENE.GHVQ01000987.1~~GHVQ01000987.1.p1  ORF type:complete len:901 (+),score=168.63 GHVQ01000987.1:256-2958(+)